CQVWDSTRDHALF
nr:immunoglobulin light chain junction region [Macaca mulatta]MPO03535.1 immunoglobulin light chain junction region [Macaca mulatta]MPO03920.1 immunoglobulin light chain junction region [Macaca mulatta]MPO04174.1 immunoglobulin light chain junction region [Macaca mulatta]MPO04557.1 immunoglobulin light chain junction region [Macaca mulatta]